MKEQLNLAFLGPSQGGKSTLCGLLLTEFGGSKLYRKMVKDRKIQQEEQQKQQQNEQKEQQQNQDQQQKQNEDLEIVNPKQYLQQLIHKNNIPLEQQYSCLISRTNLEIEKNKTLNVHIDHFKISQRYYNVIDVPGDLKKYTNIIAGISQAQAAILVISADQTILTDELKDLITISYTLSVKQLICCINQMDKIKYSEKQYDNIVKELKKFIKIVGFISQKVHFIPITAYHSDNITSKSQNMQWYNGPWLSQIIEKLTPVEGPKEKPLRISVLCNLDLNQNQSLIIGKVESGKLEKNTKLNINNKEIALNQIQQFDIEVQEAFPYSMVGIEVEKTTHLRRGIILSSFKEQQRLCKEFKATFLVLKSEGGLIPKQKFIFYFSCTKSKCQFTQILSTIKRNSTTVIKENPEKLLNGESAYVLVQSEKGIQIENFNDVPSLGRFVIIVNKKLYGVGIVNEITQYV